MDVTTVARRPGEAAHIQPRCLSITSWRHNASGTLHVEACTLGHFFCSGDDWTRVEERRERVLTTSRQWRARS
jgi:hypothetical protein